MKRALLILAAFIGTALPSLAQVTSITVEEFYTDDQTIAGYPAGHTTYRIYANTTNSTDRVVTVSGDDINPLVLNVSGSGIWNYQPGGELGDAVPCILYNSFPLAEYDSYLTIGYNCDNDGGSYDVYGAEDTSATWQTEMFNTLPYGMGSVTVNTPVGGTWFVIPTNPASAGGVDNKVLLAQITTDGDICGFFNLQVFPQYVNPGDPNILQNALEFSSGNCGTPGCTDPAALNYDATAGYDNGLCLYDCALLPSSVSYTTVNPSCASNEDGSIEITGTGNQSYIYYTFVNDPDLNTDDSGLSDDGIESFTDLGNGTYTFTLRDTRFDNEIANPNGLTCEVTIDVTLNTPDLFMTSSVGEAVTCGGDQDGCVTTVPANYGGGTGALSFSIVNNANNSVVQSNLPDPNYCGLAGGTYHFEVTDANNCSASGANFTIAAPATLTLVQGNQTPASCFNTSDAIQVIIWVGGTGDVDFSLEDDGIYEIEGNLANAVLNNLAGGTNMIYAADANGCTAELAFEVNAGPEITINPDVTDALCNGDSNGSISIMAGGGTPPLQYSFDGVTYSSNADLIDLAAADYMVYVKDANDCVASQTVAVAEPEVLTATVAATSISCNGLGDGILVITASGGTEPYAYSTTDGGYTPSGTIGNLQAGVYDIHVMDGNGCHFMEMEAAEITEPGVLNSEGLASDVSCFGECDGEIAFATTGGTGAYSYSLNGEPAVTNDVVGNLCSDTYSVVVTDANGCETTIAAIEIDEPAALVITGLQPDPINQDPGGNTDYTVSGGTSPYSYDWVGPNNFSSTDEDLPALTADNQDGDYTLTVTDDNGCEVTQTINVTGLGELGHEYFISMYPNPNNGEFVVNISGMKGEKMNYVVVDANGRVVLGKELGNVNGTRIENFDMKEVAAGIYNIQFVIGTEVHSLRFVKN